MVNFFLVWRKKRVLLESNGYLGALSFENFFGKSILL